MARSPRIIFSFAVAMALAAPAVAFGQATSRGGGSNGNSSGQAVPRSESSGTATASAGGSSGGGSVTPVSSPALPELPPPQPMDQQRQATQSSSRTGSTATSRPSGTASSGGAATGSAAPAASGGGQQTARPRNGRPSVGTAVARPPVATASSVPLTVFGGFGWNLGYYGFSPYSYYYGPGSYYWNPLWGGWYDPFYDPFYYDPMYARYGYGQRGPRLYGGAESAASAYARPAMGSLRLKASPGTAKVYIDGKQMGTVDDFDGLTHHLEVAVGAHVLELRADGYQTLSTDINVGTGTTTLRYTLKKK